MRAGVGDNRTMRHLDGMSPSTPRSREGVAMRKMLPIVMVVAAAYSTHAFADEVTCESKSSKRVECSMDTRGEVRIVKQLSNAACVEGRTWGLSKHSVWVDKGCR